MSKRVHVDAVKTIQTRDQLLDTDNLKYLLCQESPVKRTEVENALEEKARSFKALGQLRKLIKAIATEAEAENKAKSEQTLPEVINNEFELIDNSEPWTCDERGVYRYYKGKLEVACLCQVSIKELLRDSETNMWYVVLKITRDNQTQEVTVPRQTITDINKIQSLAQYGLGVNFRTAGNLLDYLTILEFSSENPIPRRTSISHFGWHNGVFVPYDNSIVVAGHQTLLKIKESISEHGDIEKWINMYKEIRKSTNIHYEPQLFVSAALASILIGPLGMYPFILNKWDETGSGKTVNLRLAASVWGNPQEYISDSDSTKNAMIARAAILYDLPICIDDFAKAIRDEKQISELIYSLSAGREKDRLDAESNLKSRREWHGCSLTTNEFPLVTDEMRGGALNRVIDIQGTNGDIFEDPGTVYNICSQNYGFLGPLFIERLISQDGYIEKFSKGVTNTFKALKDIAARKCKHIEDKQLLPLALILVTDAFVTDRIFYDNIRLNPGRLLEQLRSHEEVSDGQRTYNEILDFISANQGRFINMGLFDSSPISFVDVYGYIDNAGKLVHFIPAQFQKLMNDKGRNVKAFCRWAKERQLIVEYKGNLNQKRIFGETKKVYTFVLRYESEGKDISDLDLPEDMPDFEV